MRLSSHNILAGFLPCHFMSLTGIATPARAAEMKLSIENLGGTCFSGISGPCYYQEFNFDVAWVIRGIEGVRIGETRATNIAVIDFLGPPGSGTVELFTTAPITILTQDDNSMTLDFSGWSERYIAWDGAEYYAGGDPNALAPHWWDNGISNLTCGLDCGHGDTYSLEYKSYLYKPGDPDWIGSFVAYHLEGHIGLVSHTPAFWLFSSGLFGMVSRKVRA